MSSVRALILVCSVLALSACSSGKNAQPDIETIDEPAPSAWPVDAADNVATSTWTLCSHERGNDDCEPTPEHEAWVRRIEGKPKRTTTPLSSSEARAIAQLRIQHSGTNARLRLIAWKTKSGKLCLAHDETDGERSSGGGPFGPCLPHGRCGAMCLAFPGIVSSETLGVVSAKADSLRITFLGGRVATYKLKGPLVPSFSEYRVFMLDSRRDIPTRFELLVGNTVLAQKSRSVAELRAMCPDRPTVPGADSCLQRPEAK